MNTYGGLPNEKDEMSVVMNEISKAKVLNAYFGTLQGVDMSPDRGLGPSFLPSDPEDL